MGKNMKKSKQNVVGKVKDFKKTKVKVGRKLKNITETLPKVQVAKICVRSQFNSDHRADRLFNDEYKVPKVITQPIPSLSKLQQLSKEMHAILKQTQTGKKAETRKDSLAQLNYHLSSHHPSVTSTNLLDLLEALCVLIVDSDSSIRTEIPKLLRVVLSRLKQARGLDENIGLDWTSDHFPMVMAYIFRAMSNNHFNTTSLLNLEVILDLCPLVVLTTSYRISQSLLKMILNQNAGVLSKKQNKKKQILSIEGDEWSGLSHQCSPSQNARINMFQVVCKFIKVLLNADRTNKISYLEYKDNLLDEACKCLHFAADVIKIMVDVFIDAFYQSRNKGRTQKKDEDDDGGATKRSIVMMDEGSLDVMKSCLNTIHHALLLTHHTTTTALSRTNKCDSINESISLLTASFPYSAVMRKNKNNKHLNNVKNNKDKNINKNNTNAKNNKKEIFRRINEIDVGRDLNEKIACIILSFYHLLHLSTLQSSPRQTSHLFLHSPPHAVILSQPLSTFKWLTHKLVRALSHESLIHLPHQSSFYSHLLEFYAVAVGNNSCNVSASDKNVTGNYGNDNVSRGNKLTSKGIKTESVKDLAEGIMKDGLDGMKVLVGRLRGLIEEDKRQEIIVKKKLNQIVSENQTQPMDTLTSATKVDEQQVATSDVDQMQLMQQTQDQLNETVHLQQQKQKKLTMQQNKQHLNLERVLKDFMFWFKIFSNPSYSFLPGLKCVKGIAVEFLTMLVDVMMMTGRSEENGSDYDDDLQFLINSVRTCVKEKRKDLKEIKINFEIENRQNKIDNFNLANGKTSENEDDLLKLVEDIDKVLDFNFLVKLGFMNQRAMLALVADCWLTSYNLNKKINDTIMTDDTHVKNLENLTSYFAKTENKTNNINFVSLSKQCLHYLLTSNAYYDFLETLAEGVKSGDDDECKEMLINYVLHNLQAYDFDKNVEDLESFKKNKTRLTKFSSLKVAQVVGRDTTKDED